MPIPALIGGALIGGASNILGGLLQGGQNAAAFNREAAYNWKMLKYQNTYNSPVEQMARFRAAGLNPNLIYGQGNAGNMSSAPSSPRYQTVDVAGGVQNTVGTALAVRAQEQQMKLMESQESLNRVKSGESIQKAELMQAQSDLVRANPYMKESYVNAIVTTAESVARMKAQESDFALSKTQDSTTGVRWERGFLKMQKELDLLTQKFNLNAEDLKIKAEILQSKDFQNYMNDIMKRFMSDGELSNAQVLDFVKMVLSKLAIGR